MRIPGELKFDSAGLIPAVVQCDATGAVLMVGYMNHEAVKRTLASGHVTFWSRSRSEFWVKGETSGHTQELKAMYVDCDADCLLIRVEQTGPACHEGYRSCFFRRVEADGTSASVAAERLKTREEIYGQGR
ncbi:MAG: phosphoribosyl-AMP cyclohydrolase [Chthonomonadales bacterium]|nr:phosphoribosyl-AMP cyclohydrolase [Chthonomonadales bacterium]